VLEKEVVNFETGEVEKIIAKALGDLKLNIMFRANTWMACEHALEDGLTRYIGVSNYMVEHLREMELYATFMPAVNQVELHPYLPQTDLLKWCNAHDIRVEAYGSIVQAGKKDPDQSNAA